METIADVKRKRLVEELGMVALDELPDLLRALAEHVEKRLSYHRETLAETVLDFERGVKTFPELLEAAREAVA